MNILTNKPLSDSAEFNYLLDEFRNSVDIEIAKAVSVSNSSFDIINKYGVQRLEDINAQIKKIKDGIIEIEYANQTDAVINIDLSSSNSKEYTFIDPKTNTLIGQSCRCISGKLLPLSESSLIDISSLSYVAKTIDPIHMIDRSANGLIDIYLFSKTNTPPFINFDILHPEGIVNYLKLNILSEYPLVINDAHNIIGEFFIQNTLSDPVETTTKFTINTIIQLQAKATNSISDFNVIIDDYELLQIPDPNYNAYNWYVYNIRFKIEEIGYMKYIYPMVYISPEYRIDQLQSIEIDDLVNIGTPYQCTLDKYVEIKDYDHNNHELSLNILPIRTYYVYTFGSNIDHIYLENMKPAKLKFFPRSSVQIYNKNHEPEECFYEVVGDTITAETQYDDWRIIEYDVVPSSNYLQYFPYDVESYEVLKETIYKYSIEDIVKFDGTNEYPPDSLSGTKYLKIKLDYSIRLDDNAITRIMDDGSPINEQYPQYVYSGTDKNVYLNGRILYIPFDVETYPYLYNCAYKIRYYALNPLSIPDFKYFFSGQEYGKIISNWEYVKNMKDYSYSTIRLCYIVRNYSDNAPNMPASIDYIKIKYSTFNDTQNAL